MKTLQIFVLEAGTRIATYPQKQKSLTCFIPQNRRRSRRELWYFQNETNLSDRLPHFYHNFQRLSLGGVLGQVQVELLCRAVQAVLVDGLDTLRRQPQPHPSVALLPEEPPLLKVNMLHLSYTVQ